MPTVAWRSAFVPYLHYADADQSESTTHDLAPPDHHEGIKMSVGDGSRPATANEKHCRTTQEHLVAAAQHRRAAQRHERAAQAHCRAAERGIGDLNTHLEAMAVYRTARDREYRAADADSWLAEHP
jgi:hypothetical protein